MTPDIIHSNNFLRDALALIRRTANAAISERGVFRMGLSGGSTPRPIYEALAQWPGHDEADWEHWEFTFGDERCVPPNDQQSNYRMVREALLDHVAIPPENVLRMRGEDAPEEAAADYERMLRSRAGEEGLYRHDLLLLGMGDDGHTASLFPDTDALTETKRWVVANFVPKFNTHRITLTFPILNAARHAVFLVNSRGKENTLEQVFSGKSLFPCSRVQPKQGKVTWLLSA